jgi:hypothetical protein
MKVTPPVVGRGVYGSLSDIELDALCRGSAATPARLFYDARLSETGGTQAQAVSNHLSLHQHACSAIHLSGPGWSHWVAFSFRFISKTLQAEVYDSANSATTERIVRDVLGRVFAAISIAFRSCRRQRRGSRDSGLVVASFLRLLAEHGPSAIATDNCIVSKEQARRLLIAGQLEQAIITAAQLLTSNTQICSRSTIFRRCKLFLQILCHFLPQKSEPIGMV